MRDEPDHLPERAVKPSPSARNDVHVTGAEPRTIVFAHGSGWRWISKLRALGITVALAALAGCQAPGVNLQSLEPHAVDVALRRAQLDSMCANVTPTVVDRQQETPSRATGGNVLLVYAIDVAGCGQRKAYQVKCPAVGGACFVATNRE